MKFLQTPVSSAVVLLLFVFQSAQMSLSTAAAAEDDDIVYRELRAWTFPDDLNSDWMIMADRSETSSECLQLLPKKSGPVIRLLSLRQRALDVAAVDIVIDREQQRPVSGMRLFWARQADLERVQNWPFSNERSAPFQLVEEKDGLQRWRADIAFHGNWIGTITGFFIGATVPEHFQDSGVVVCIRELSMQEEVWNIEKDSEPDKEEIE